MAVTHLWLSLAAVLRSCAAFNLDVENPTVYCGPEGSYFGYAVDFYLANTTSVSVLVGAPKANTSQTNITEGGSVFYCPWSLNQANCHSIAFDSEGDRPVRLNDTDHQAEFKSHQWFGATVRSHGDTILACAPLYSWRTKEDIPRADTTGTCYLSVGNFSKFVEYAPCRTEFFGRPGQGYCQGGFSADFTKDGKVVLGGPGSFFWQGQVITAVKEEIIKAFYPGYFLSFVRGEKQTRANIRNIYHDDTYKGKMYYFVAGIPKGARLHGLLGVWWYFLHDFQLYVSVLRLTDLLVGAPMFMLRDTDGRLEEMGRVYLYLQKGLLDLQPQLPHLTGTQVFGRFGSSIAPLGDLNLDGFNDVAVSCPFGGEDKQGLVLIYNGFSGGVRDKPSQVITGQWASGMLPSSFGFTMRGSQDLDRNGYPDLIVGAFGVDKAILYRSRPIVNTSASLSVYPAMINPEEKHCLLSKGNETMAVSCVNLSVCLSANGKYVPDNLEFHVEVQLDRLKQKGAVRRTLFVDSQQPTLQRNVKVPNGARVCHETKIYLRDEKEFRDKLSPIYVALNFSLDPQAATDTHGLRPILNYQTTEFLEQKAQILLDCGEDNICVPDLKLSVQGDRKEVYLGDENALTLTFNAKNEGGGAYEAELYVVLPPEADYRSSLWRGHLWAGLRFTVPRLKDTRKTVQFDLQIRSKNENNSHSEMIAYKVEVKVQADVILQGVSRPDKVFFPPQDWRVTKRLEVEQDVGPSIQHVYELVNNGPSRISHTLLELRCPKNLLGHRFMYPLEVTSEGPVNCTTNHTVNPFRLKLQQTSTEQPPLLSSHEHHIEKREVHKGQMTELSNLSCANVDCWTLTCHVGLLEKGTSAILKVRSRIWAETFMQYTYRNYVLECQASYKVEKMPYAILPLETPSGARKVVTPVVWNKSESQYAVPLWIIILAILAGLLLLALLIYVLYKLGFFKRTEYGTALEKAQLKPQAASEA
uniref:Integrin alpha-2 domain-containing protein n=1 Tax=Denticeps clupeoides TaxID=299321 RepID=A0AAY4CJX8_9TELE